MTVPTRTSGQSLGPGWMVQADDRRNGAICLKALCALSEPAFALHLYRPVSIGLKSGTLYPRAWRDRSVGALTSYLAIQSQESYLLATMIQGRAVSVPPAILFASQIVLGVLFGFYGLALATPLAATGRIFMLRLYVQNGERP